MQDWMLYRHQATNAQGKPAAIYWARVSEYKERVYDEENQLHGTVHFMDVRSPLNAAGFGSEEESEGIKSPERSARAPRFPLSIFDDKYHLISEEEALELIKQ